MVECTALELRSGDVIRDLQGKLHEVTSVSEGVEDCWNGEDFVPTAVVSVYTDTYPEGRAGTYAATYRVVNR